MSARNTDVRRWRTILDCVLIVLILLFAGARYLNVQARSQAQTSSPVLANHPLPATGLSVQSDSPPSIPELDSNGWAAVFAAENAALTLPIYFNDLPFVVH